MTRNFSKFAKSGSAFLAALGLSLTASAMVQSNQQDQNQQQQSYEQVCEKMSQCDVSWPDTYEEKMDFTPFYEFKGGIHEYQEDNKVTIQVELLKHHTGKNAVKYKYGKKGVKELLDTKEEWPDQKEEWVEVCGKDGKNIIDQNSQQQQQLSNAIESQQIMRVDHAPQKAPLGNGELEVNDLLENNKVHKLYHIKYVEGGTWGRKGRKVLTEDEAIKVFGKLRGSAIKSWKSNKQSKSSHSQISQKNSK